MDWAYTFVAIKIPKHTHYNGMKKLILSLMAAGFAATSYAQVNCPGGLLLYGVGSYSNSHGSSTSKFSNANANTINDPRSLMWEVSPGLGFNITNNLTIGIDFNYTGSKTTWDRKDPSIYGNNPIVPATYGEDQVKTYDWALGPFVRYTKSISPMFFAYGQFEAHYLSGRRTTRTVTQMVGGNSFTRDDNYKGVDVSFMPAVGINVSPSVALTFGVGGVGYEYTKWDFSTQGYPAGTELTGKNNNFEVSFGRQFNVGIQKSFGCVRPRHHREPMDDTRAIDTSDDESTDSDSRSKRRRRSNDDE